jgi:hypothetical protein
MTAHEEAGRFTAAIGLVHALYVRFQKRDVAS